MSLPNQNKFLCSCLVLGAAFLSLTSWGHAEEPFPLYPSIRTNVAFWEDVYSRYTTRQGILHDKDNLAIIYTIVDLVDWNTRGAARINRKMIKLARHRYKKILTNLASGRKPATDEEKRVASLFPGHSRRTYSRARNNIRLQIGQKDRFLRGVIRSGAYMPTIKRIFQTYSLPPELAYLPHVESSFNPKAHSKAGASGLWQFTRSTGRQYMTINDVVDERNDPYFATKSAAIFLKKNFELLGSWPLAITAYNYGTSGMLRAKKKMGGYEKIFNSHKTRIFKFASRNFYSEFLAALRVAQRLEEDSSIIIDRPEATISVRMNGYADALGLLHYFRIQEEDFSRLNPALKKSVLEGKKYIPENFLVRLPASDRIRTLAAAIPSTVYRSEQVRDNIYIVRRGDTSGAIARRYGISLSELIQANALDRRATIRIGQKLKIPGTTGGTGSSHIIVLTAGSKNKPR
jgi:membrane-bound lytic murein transglycosylase D